MGGQRGQGDIEIFSTSPLCVSTCYIFEAEDAIGPVNPETKEVVVDFLNVVETYEGESSINQCLAPQIVEKPVIRFYFILNDQGELLLCTLDRNG